jgi:hypothetical protein
MRRLIPTSPQARAVVGLVTVMAVAVGVLGALSSGSGDRAEVVPTDEEAAGTTSTTRASSTTPATVLGAVIDRDDADADDSGDAGPPVATTTAAAPPPTASAPATAAPPAPPPTTAAPPATEAPPAREAPTTTTAPAPSTVAVTVQVSTTEPIEVVLRRGTEVARQVLLAPDGGSATFEDLPPGAYQVYASWTVPPPTDQDPDGPQVGPGGRTDRSDPFELAPGDRLTAILDDSGWTLVLG